MLRTMRICGISLVAAATLSCTPASGDTTEVKENPIVIGHRGYAAVAPENTLSSVSAALEAGGRFMEIDVQLTSDDGLVLMHDRTVDRTTNGSGRVRDLTVAEVTRLDAGSWYGEKFHGEPVPTLDEVLDLILSVDATLVIEVKRPSPDSDPAEPLARLIQERDAENNVVVVSFDRRWLRDLRELDPGIRTGDLWIRPRLLLPKTSSDVVSVHWSTFYLDPTAVRRLHRQGFTIWAWTVDSPRIARRLTRLGVDGIITDEYEMVSESLESQP